MSDSPELIAQDHGGALLSGGKPGNKGGSGRPPSELRRRLRSSLDKRIAVAEEIADDDTRRAADRLRAIDLLAKYGLGPNDPAKVSRDEFGDLMEQLGSVVAEEVRDREVLARIEARWLKLLEATG
jgi:hypothetical protein